VYEVNACPLMVTFVVIVVVGKQLYSLLTSSSPWNKPLDIEAAHRLSRAEPKMTRSEKSTDSARTSYLEHV
jgi:hypothetical protein